ncbi:MAG: transposase [Hyphomonas sp. BRH_c22]|uniref:IS110 family transposase n=1 Tax=Hyphomonas sp. BRH_c22 TaxID=1629710 RepID=UPI0005F23193|nr:IS110 family transposase [Hyphomonas sp. BRH_c22]KJS37211.1 MAG: transposase [Hyphomonas sp. BRH_c22]
MNVYIGLDVSLRSVAMCVVDLKGAIVEELNLPCEVESIASHIEAADYQVERIGFEAGAMSQMLFHGLTAKGFDTVCMEARQVAAALSAMRNKTDKTDARGIAHILRAGWYNPVHMKSRESHDIKALLAARKAILNKCIDLENEIRGLFKAFGIRLPSHVSRLRFDEKVRPIIEADEALAFALLPMLDVRGALYDTYRLMEQRVIVVSRHDPVCKLLMTAPGIGPITALSFKAAVDDPTRFNSSRLVGAHFGLTPRRFQSGEMDNPGRISRAGDKDVRATLYNAANSLLLRSTRPSSLKTWGLRLIRTKGTRRARIAVARKLAVILHRMWVTNTPFKAEGTA